MVFTCEFSLEGFPNGIPASAVGLAVAVGFTAGFVTGLIPSVDCDGFPQETMASTTSMLPNNISESCLEKINITYCDRTV